MRCAAGPQRLQRQGHVKVQVGKQTLTFASGTLTAKAGESVTLKLKPRGAASRGAQGEAVLTVTVTLSDGQRATLTKKLKLPRK